MKEKFPILIGNIEALKNELDFDSRGFEIELNHKINVHQGQDSYYIQIFFIRPRSLYYTTDIFIISEINDYIEIKYCRKNEPKIPELTRNIPNFLERTFTFQKNQEQDFIYKELMKQITDFFKLHNYVDNTYKSESEDWDFDDEEDI
ncbi:MAG: hypothetical protein RBR97_19465 [Bacteroidales bacterium]|jgi:hypothetical protein|nr:hypothetical protein [Bacteroidales bacterium]